MRKKYENRMVDTDMGSDHLNYSKFLFQED
jgi:hypothetical protein